MQSLVIIFNRMQNMAYLFDEDGRRGIRVARRSSSCNLESQHRVQRQASLLRTIEANNMYYSLDIYNKQTEPHCPARLHGYTLPNNVLGFLYVTMSRISASLQEAA